MIKSFERLSKVTFIVILALSIGLFIYANVIPESKAAGHLTSMSMPKGLLFLMIVLSTTIIYREWRVPSAQINKETEPISDSPWAPIIIFVSTVFYAILFENWGFMITSVLCAAITLRCFQIKSWFVISVYSLLVPLAMLILFRNLLGLPIPVSPFSYYF